MPRRRTVHPAATAPSAPPPLTRAPRTRAPLTRAAARPLPGGARLRALSASCVHCAVAAHRVSVLRNVGSRFRLAPSGRGRAAARVRGGACGARHDGHAAEAARRRMAVLAAARPAAAAHGDRLRLLRKRVLVYAGLTFYAVLAGLPVYWMAVTSTAGRARSPRPWRRFRRPSSCPTCSPALPAATPPSRPSPGLKASTSASSPSTRSSVRGAETRPSAGRGWPAAPGRRAAGARG